MAFGYQSRTNQLQVLQGADMKLGFSPPLGPCRFSHLPPFPMGIRAGMISDKLPMENALGSRRVFL